MNATGRYFRVLAPQSALRTLAERWRKERAVDLKSISPNLRRRVFPFLLSSLLLLTGCGGGHDHETRTPRGEGIREWFLEFAWGRVEAYAVWPSGEGFSSAGPYPAILLLHGENARAQRFKRAMWTHARDGFFLISISLPGFGASTGPEDFAGPRSVEAALGAVHYLRARSGVRKDGIFVYGVGQGASVAALAAAKDEGVSGLILENGFYDLESAYTRSPALRRARIRAALGGPPAQRMDAYRARSPVRAAARIKAPALFLHNQKASYPLSGAERFVKILKEKGGRAELRRLGGQSPLALSRRPNVGKWVIPYVKKTLQAR